MRAADCMECCSCMRFLRQASSKLEDLQAVRALLDADIADKDAKLATLQTEVAALREEVCACVSLWRPVASGARSPVWTPSLLPCLGFFFFRCFSPSLVRLPSSLRTAPRTRFF